MTLPTHRGRVACLQKNIGGHQPGAKRGSRFVLAPAHHEASKRDRVSDDALVSGDSAQAERSTKPADLVLAFIVLVAAAVVVETTTPWALVTVTVVPAAIETVLPAVPPLPTPTIEMLPLIAGTPDLPIFPLRYARI